MHQVRQTAVFAKWLSRLANARAKAKILVRIESLRLGNEGDSKSLGGSLYELRIHTGPGYRIYYARQREQMVILLCGGDKSKQRRDINRARALLHELKSEQR